MTGPILVIGATGTVGSEVVKALREHNADIRAATRTPEKTIPGAKTVLFDFDKPLSIPKAFIGVEKVFILTPFDEKMVLQTRTIVNAAKNAHVKYIVKLSAVGADKPQGSLSKWHHDAEQAIIESGIPYTILRANGFMQNFSTTMAAQIKFEGKIYAPAGDAKVSFIDVRDIADAAAHAFLKEGHKNKIYTLTGPQSLTMKEIAEFFSDVLGKPITYVPLTDVQARDAYAKAHLPEWMSDALIDLYKFYRAGGGAAVSKDVQTLTNRVPVNFRSFIEEHKNAWQ